MSKHISRTVVAVLLVAALLSTTGSQASAHEPSCGDHPNQNRGLVVSSRQSLTGEQVGNARLIMGVAQQRRLPRIAAEVAITAALQASSLKNSPGNNRGLFQQTPRYYPGVAISSPGGATNAFYDRLITVPRWRTTPIATTARTVQAAKATRAFTNAAPIATVVVDRWWGNPDNPTECPTGDPSTNGTDQSSSDTNPSSATSASAPSSAATSSPAASGSNGATGQSNSQASGNRSSASRNSPTTTQRSSAKKSTTVRKITPPRISTVAGTNRVTVRGIVVNRTIGSNLQRLLTAASEDGLTLTGSGWRDPARQIALRKQNCGRSTFAIYQRSPSLCKPPTARPGTSNHEKGLAVDFRNCSTRSTACYKWLKANASKYGLRNLPSEPWHWSVNGR